MRSNLRSFALRLDWSRAVAATSARSLQARLLNEEFEPDAQDRDHPASHRYLDAPTRARATLCRHRAAKDRASGGRHANRLSGARRGRRDCRGPRNRSQHQPPGGRAAPRRGIGGLDRLDLWPRRGTRLDDVFQFHHDRRNGGQLPPRLPERQARAHALARARTPFGRSGRLQEPSHAVRRSFAPTRDDAALPRHRHDADRRHRNQRLLRMHRARRGDAQLQDDHDFGRQRLAQRRGA